jgi:hypothetical protein
MSVSNDCRITGTNVVNGKLVVAGIGNRIANLSANASASISYDVRSVNAGGTSVMLQGDTALSGAQAAKYAAVVAVGQDMGVYELSSNITLANNTSFAISQGTSSLGSAVLNGTALAKDGVSYSVGTTGAAGQVNLTLTAIAGNMYKGDNGANSLGGTADCDIFYGGGGNDTIATGNGRDLLVYTTAAWGQDTVTSTGGTATLLFSGLNASDITTVKSGTSMIISRASDAAQKITVQNWNDSAHSIVYAGTLSAFNTWLNAASPTAAQATAARNEVWQKTGLLASA